MHDALDGAGVPVVTPSFDGPFGRTFTPGPARREGGTGGLSPAGFRAPGHHVIGSESKPSVPVSENHPA